MRLVLSFAAAAFFASVANASVTYQFTALSGGYNNTGFFTVTLPDFVTGVNLFPYPGNGYTAPALTSCMVETGGFGDVPAQTLSCGPEQFLLNNVTQLTSSGTYDVVGFSFDVPGDTLPCCGTSLYYFDQAAFQSVGHHESILLGSDQAGTLDVFLSGVVPEPATWVMMLIGFGGVGAALRRKRRVLQNN